MKTDPLTLYHDIIIYEKQAYESEISYACPNEEVDYSSSIIHIGSTGLLDFSSSAIWTNTVSGIEDVYKEIEKSQYYLWRAMNAAISSLMNSK